ncbi:MAG: hypothetical protein U0T75_03775 [Chitinophagales bacterium]
MSGIVAGNYVFTTDSKGCTISDTVVVIEPQPLSTSGFIKHVTCAGNADACIDITAYGGTCLTLLPGATAQAPKMFVT